MQNLISPRILMLGTGLLIALGGGAAAFWHATNGENPQTSAAKSPASVDMRVPVRVFQVQAAAGVKQFELTGTIRPRYQTDIAFRVSGKILRRMIEVGQQVTAGQPLFELDAEDYQLQLKSAQAEVQSAKAAVLQSVAEEKRLRELRRTNAVSASEYDIGLSNRDVAVAKQESEQKKLELAQNQLDYCHLVADADGTVTSISAEAGQVVTFGMPVCAIAQLSELEAVIDIPENRWPKDPQLHTQAAFWSLPGAHCEAQLREIAPTADPLTRTYRARFTLINPPAEIKLGMTATVTIAESSDAATFEVPASSLIRTDGQPAVWRIEADGQLTSLPVVIAQYSAASVKIASGLQGGERIVSAGVHKLNSTTKVRVWEMQK